MFKNEIFDDLSVLLVYKRVKNALLIRLINYDMNKALLQTVPHIIIGDMAATYHILTEDGDKLKLAIINNEMFDFYNISIEQLHLDALVSTQRLQPIKVITFSEAIEDAKKDWPAYVLTNLNGFNGSVTILYPGVLDYISSLLDDDLSLVPLSTNEWIATTETFAKEKKLKQFMKQNKEKNNQFLSNTLYHFDRVEHRLETDDEFIERIKEKVVN